MDEQTAAFVMKNFVASLVFFATGAFLGFFLTAFVPMTLASWPWVFYGRIVWQLGGAAWLGLAITWMLGSSFKAQVICFVACTAVGALLSFNPLLDVIEHGGPVVLVGARLEGFETDEVSLKNQVQGIVADLTLRDAEGNTLELGTRGLQANRWQWAFDDCEANGWRPEVDTVDIIAFDHLGILVELKCPGSGVAPR